MVSPQLMGKCQMSLGMKGFYGFVPGDLLAEKPKNKASIDHSIVDEQRWRDG